MLKKSVLLVFLSIAVSACLCSSSYSGERLFHKVRWVDDGDTIVLSNGIRVRYIGINAPETTIVRSGKQLKAGEPFGPQAKKLNEKLVYRNNVRLEFDREKYDEYGRHLAYVFLEDNTFVNKLLLLEGLAYCLPIKPNMRYSSQFLNAQRQAMKKKRGIWRAIDTATTDVKGNRRSMRFHLPGCRFGKTISSKNTVAFKSIYDAFHEGFAPCKRCNPTGSAKSR